LTPSQTFIEKKQEWANLSDEEEEEEQQETTQRVTKPKKKKTSKPAGSSKVSVLN